MGRYHGQESIHLRIWREYTLRDERFRRQAQVDSSGFELESHSDGLIKWPNEKMIYKTKRVLRMRSAVVLVCLNKLIHQLGQYSRHLTLNASKQDVSQLISQRANTKIGRRQSRPDPRFKERGLLRAYLLE